MLQINNIYKFRPSNNIKYLERTLGIPIMETLQSDIDNYIAKLNNETGMLANRDIPFSIDVTKSDPIKVSLTFDGQKRSLLQLKNGLPYANRNDWLYSGAKLIRNKVKFDELLMDVHNFTNFNKLCTKVQRRINKLIKEDMAKLNKDKRNLQKLYRGDYGYDEDTYMYDDDLAREQRKSISREFANAVLIRNKNRLFCHLGLYSNRKLTLLQLIQYDFDKYLQSVNKSIKFWCYIEIKRLFLPKYLESTQKLSLQLKIIGKMLLSQYHAEHLVSIPKVVSNRFMALLNKYQMGYFLIEKHRELIEFDTNNLIKNDAHPKEIKDLITKFYIKHSACPLTEKIITKILRLNYRSFATKDKLFAEQHGFLSDEHFLMVIFSDMPQVNLLNSTRKNKAEIHSYMSAFLVTLSFCRFFCDFTEAVVITKATLRKGLYHKKYISTVKNARDELKRFCNEIYDNQQELLDTLAKVPVWSIKKLISLHDNVVNTLNAYRNDYNRSKNHPLVIQHIEHKLIEPLVIDDFNFTQLTTSQELINEGQKMHHCVGSYYSDNYHSGLFIFGVKPNKNNFADDIEHYSTLAISLHEDEIYINQNYTQSNYRPSPENETVVDKFVKHLEAQHLELFKRYIKTSNKLREQPFNENSDQLDKSFYVRCLLDMTVKKS